MRLIGNKTHGDLAEIAIAELINQYRYDFRSVHIGKDLYRAKSGAKGLVRPGLYRIPIDKTKFGDLI